MKTNSLFLAFACLLSTAPSFAGSCSLKGSGPISYQVAVGTESYEVRDPGPTVVVVTGEGATSYGGGSHTEYRTVYETRTRYSFYLSMEGQNIFEGEFNEIIDGMAGAQSEALCESLAPANCRARPALGGQAQVEVNGKVAMLIDRGSSAESYREATKAVALLAIKGLCK